MNCIPSNRVVQRHRVTTRREAQSYVYMGYWRYRLMAYEESLQDFEYFISWDTDALLTQPMEVDPFKILQRHNLTGFFLCDMGNYGFDQGIEEVAQHVFGSNVTGRGYLNSPDTFPLVFMDFVLVADLIFFDLQSFENTAGVWFPLPISTASMNRLSLPWPGVCWPPTVCGIYPVEDTRWASIVIVSLTTSTNWLILPSRLL